MRDERASPVKCSRTSCHEGYFFHVDSRMLVMEEGIR